MMLPSRESTLQSELTLQPFRSKSQYMREAIQIYAEVWQQDAYDSGYRLRQYLQFPCFYGCLAQVNGQTMGMGFGTASVRGMWWHDRVAYQVGAQHPALQDAWLLTELAVLESQRGMGIGAVLLKYLTDAQPRNNLLLSTQSDNHAAIRFYQRHGWSILHPGFAFHRHGKSYAILSRSLR